MSTSVGDSDIHKINRRAVYAEAQMKSTSNLGRSLYNDCNGTFTTSSSSSFRKIRGSKIEADGEELYSSLRSSINTQNTFNYSQHRDRSYSSGMSPSGNPMTSVRITEQESDADMEREWKEEVRQIRMAVADINREDSGAVSGGGWKQLSDSSTIASSSHPSDSKQRGAILENGGVSSLPSSSPFVISEFNEPTTDLDKARYHMKKILSSPSCRRTLFLGIVSFFLALALFLTIENVINVKSPTDWLESSSLGRNMYSNYAKSVNAAKSAQGDEVSSKGGGSVETGGIDWSFGPDAPKAIAGAVVDPSVDQFVSDWARGTSRVQSASSNDGFGSLALSEFVMFRDIPLFWGEGFSGGTVLEDALGGCLKLVQAGGKRGVDIMDDVEYDDNLNLSLLSLVGKKFVNVNLSTVEGIERAKQLGFGSSGMADVVYSPLFHEVLSLFSTVNQARLFMLAQHPVEREFARFRHLLQNGLVEIPERYNELKGMSYDNFAYSDFVVDNWMTRSLAKKLNKEEEVTQDDLHTAKEILKRKAVIGLHDDILGAVRHYARYFGWDNAINGGFMSNPTLKCIGDEILEGMKRDEEAESNLDGEQISEGSFAWNGVLEKNKFDYDLFLYAKLLYKYQMELS